MIPHGTAAVIAAVVMAGSAIVGPAAGRSNARANGRTCPAAPGPHDRRGSEADGNTASRTGVPTQATGAARAARCAPARSTATIAAGAVAFEGRRYQLYPETLDALPAIPSPLTTADGTELILVITESARYGIVPVTLEPKRRQCDADGRDFPTLASNGWHAEAELDGARTIAGRSTAEITELARPGRLSTDGFLSADEDIVSVLRADNRTATRLGLTHPELARPLFHILNLMETDLALDRWNMATHRWKNVVALRSHGRRVSVVAGDTKGGQHSIFDDGLEGAFWIEISGELTAREREFLRTRYGHLAPQQMDALVRALTRIQTGDIEPYYITWYGFYEGKTPWRTDPIAIAFVFGLRSLEQIEAAFPGQLHDVMMARYAGTGFPAR